MIPGSHQGTFFTIDPIFAHVPKILIPDRKSMKCFIPDLPKWHSLSLIPQKLVDSDPMACDLRSQGCDPWFHIPCYDPDAKLHQTSTNLHCTLSKLYCLWRYESLVVRALDLRMDQGLRIQAWFLHHVASWGEKLNSTLPQPLPSLNKTYNTYIVNCTKASMSDFPQISEKFFRVLLVK